MKNNTKNICLNCPRQCKVNRTCAVGFCGEKNKMRVAKVMVHNWEEPIISGTNGSGAIFFAGCNLKCEFCQNWEISNNQVGSEITPLELTEIFKELEKKNVHNINLVTPTHFSSQIAEALRLYKPKIPVVYNCGGYESIEKIEELKNLVDVYLIDLKYYNNDLSQKYSHAPNYFEVASKAILKIMELYPENHFENGILTRGVIIRHLILPNCTTDSISIADWLSKNVSKNTIISLMSQFVPLYNAKNFPEINRKISKLEYKRVLTHFDNLGFENIFSQKLESASQNYVPNFLKK